jgi:hypothetical protein
MAQEKFFAMLSNVLTLTSPSFSSTSKTEENFGAISHTFPKPVKKIKNCAQKYPKLSLMADSRRPT